MTEISHKDARIYLLALRPYLELKDAELFANCFISTFVDGLYFCFLCRTNYYWLFNLSLDSWLNELLSCILLSDHDRQVLILSCLSLLLCQFHLLVTQKRSLGLQFYHFDIFNSFSQKKPHPLNLLHLLALKWQVVKVLIYLTKVCFCLALSYFKT